MRDAPYHPHVYALPRPGKLLLSEGAEYLNHLPVTRHGHLPDLSESPVSGTLVPPTVTSAAGAAIAGGRATHGTYGARRVES